ncbi:MAG: hypothetical protein EOL88_08170 [Bacteroidia bacterium]|nr:hypothetical protein [Bacteroidales bacterium]NCD42052.1 hypothetical protein [Bacteroidia bacterium]MDD2322220.1 hypothetical protein [Bacteroidales bacterium]MDD3009792.1 hypothetical protein [Bacteroidales bacterium]MDD3960302.1 hypothetical protein [Bacteroidales bacterium]
MTNRHNTDQLFRDAAVAYREKPAPEAWASIELALGGRHRRQRYLVLSSAAAVLILLLGFGAGYLVRSFTGQNPAVLLPLTSQNSNLFFSGYPRPMDLLAIQSGAMQTKLSVGQAVSVTASLPEVQQNARIPIPKDGIMPANRLADSQTGMVLSGEESSMPAEIGNGVQKTEVKLSQAEKEYQLRQMMAGNGLPLRHSAPVNLNSSGVDAETMPGKTTGRKSWAVEGDVAAAFTYRTLQEQEALYKARSPLASESGMVSWNAGLYASHEIAGNLRLKSGVTFASYGQGTTNIYAWEEGVMFHLNSSSGDISTVMHEAKDASKPISNDNVYSEPYRILLDNSMLMADYSLSNPELKIIQRFDYLELPLILQVQMGNQEHPLVSFQAEGGVFAGILAGNRAFLANEKESWFIGNTDDLRPFSLGGILSAGAQIHISDVLSAAVKPEFRYSFMSISRNPNIQYHPYQFALGVGAVYHF